MSDYAFKPALVRPAGAWRLAGGVLTKPDGGEVRLADVARGRLVQTPVGRSWSTELTLWDDNGRRARIACNGAVRGEAQIECRRLCRDVLRELDRVRPAATFQPGVGRWFGVLIALIGSGMLLYGLYFVFLAVRDRELFPAVLGMIFALPGLLAIWGGAPWRKTPTQRPAEAAATLDRWAAGNG